MRKIRICYTLNTFDLGGAETVALDLARYHDSALFEVDVVALIEPSRLTEPPMRTRFRDAGIRTHALVQSSYRSPWSLGRIFSFMLRGRYDIVHGHNRGADYWGARMAQLAGVGSVSWTRHLVYQDMQERQAARYRKLISTGARVIAVSRAVEGACLQYEGIGSEHVETIVNGVDLERFRCVADPDRKRVRAQLGIADDELMLLFVARFAEAKAPDVYAELVRRLNGRNRRIRGFMCGYGPLAAQVEELAAASGGALTVLGMRNDVPDLLSACDLFVSTSRNEGLPLNLMEAMASGAAFVAPSIPPIVELLGDREILRRQLMTTLPDAGGDLGEALAEWEAKILAILEDPGAMKIVGAVGRQAMVDDYSVQRMTSRYEEFFRQRLNRA